MNWGTEWILWGVNRMFRGNSPAKVDEKGRLKIPSAFHADLKATGEEFYVTSDNGKRAWIYPLKVWMEIEKKLGQGSSQNQAKQRFKMVTSYYGSVAALDKQGRILLHPLLREAAQTKGQVDVLGMQSYLEVWNHERFLDHMKEIAVSQDDFKALDDLGI